MHPYTQDIEPTATPSGEFTDGDPIAGLSPTVLRSAWPNMMQRELLNVLAAANITPDKQQFSQLLAAIQKLDSELKSVILNALNTHIDDHGAHASTSLLTADTIIRRDSRGSAKVADPLDAKDIANKDYVDFVKGSVKGLGMSGETWHEISRGYNISYTNSYSYPIVVSCTRKGAAWGHRTQCSVEVDGVVVQTSASKGQSSSGGGFGIATVTAIVPPGSNYKFYASGSSSSDDFREMY